MHTQCEAVSFNYHYLPGIFAIAMFSYTSNTYNIDQRGSTTNDIKGNQYNNDCDCEFH